MLLLIILIFFQNSFAKTKLQIQLVTWFLQVSVGNIGEIYKIRISHDNSGEHPGWFCDEVKPKTTILLTLFRESLFDCELDYETKNQETFIYMDWWVIY